MKQIKITSPSRLHFGQIDLNGSFGRIYGGIGAGISTPNFCVTGNKEEEIIVSGPGAQKVKLITINLIKQFQKQKLLTNNEKVNIKILETIPQHVGLGSGTQIGLCVATLINKLYDLQLNTKQLATFVDRKKSRSAIGYGVFKDGGFIVDAGRPLSQRYNEKCLPPIIFQYPIPEEWCFILVIPKSNKIGLSGKQESSTFKKIKPMKEQIVGENCRRILMQVIPGIIEKDIDLFGKAIVKIQNSVGDYFQEFQKGRFATDISQSIVDYMLQSGAYGAGQSSWGPLLYGITDEEKEALELKENIINKFQEKIKYTKIVYPENEGVKIE